MVSTNVVNIKPVLISLQKIAKKQILKYIYVEVKNGGIQNVALRCKFSLLTVHFPPFFFLTSAFILKDENEQT